MTQKQLQLKEKIFFLCFGIFFSDFFSKSPSLFNFFFEVLQISASSLKGLSVSLKPVIAILE